MPPKVLPWLSLVALIWLQSFNGTNLSFPAYSSQLKEFLSISQFKLNYLSFASDSGKVLGFISGIAAVYLPLHLVLLFGGFLGLAGYGLQYLSIVKKMFTLSFPLVWCLSFLAGNSICWINTACYIEGINSFRVNRQVAVGITASYQGLSGKIYTDMVNSFFHSSPREKASGYLLLNSLVPLVACLVTAPMLMKHGGHKKTMSSSKDVRIGFIVLFVVTIATGIYAVATSLLSAPAVLVFVGILLFLLAPLVIPIGVGLKELKLSRETQLKVHDLEAPEQFQEGHTNEEEEEEFEQEIVEFKEEVEWTQLWKKLNFWIYFGLYLFGPTVGLVFMNNLGQIAESRGSTATTSLVALSSSFGFFGRLLPSLLDYFFFRTKYMPSSPVFMVVSLLAMVASFFLLLIDSNIALFVATVVIGVFCGALTSLSVIMTAELFGTKHFGVNHNIVVGSIPIGSFAFGTLAAKVYRDGAALKGDDGKCFGLHCFQTTLVVWGMLSWIATILAAVLYIRNRKFYSHNPQKEVVLMTIP